MSQRHAREPRKYRNGDSGEGAETDKIADEIRLIYQVKDIRDELHLIARVFKNQAEVVEKFSSLFWLRINNENDQYREQFLDDCGIKGLIERVEKLDEDANRTLQAV